MRCRLQTRPTHGLNDTEAPAFSAAERRRLLGSRSTVTVSAGIGCHAGVGACEVRCTDVRWQSRVSKCMQGAFHAEKLWEAGFKGAGVKMGVFDTGIRPDHPHVKNIRCRTCLTSR